MRVPPAPERPWELAPDQVTILKNSVCKGASDDELQYCLTVARRYKLDPFKQQIWFVKRWDSSADNGHGGKGTYVWTPQVGINGLLFAAARDHKPEFGSVSLPEFGPLVDQEWSDNGKAKKFKAPEYARVKVWKKGETAPTEAEAYYDEYAPRDLSKAPFWRNMPRRMIAKCAIALAIRQAYPDLGGVYIPEEMERMNEEFTPGGRQIVQDVSLGGSREAAQAVAQRIIEEAKTKTVTPKIVPQEAPKEVLGTVEIDWSENEASPIVRGDIGNLLELIQKHCTAKWSGDWWHVLPKDAETIRAMCDQLSYKLVEVMPKPAAKAASGKEPTTVNRPEAAKPATASTPELVEGTIEQANPQSGRSPRLDVLLKLPKSKVGVWMSAWDTALFPFLTAGKGKEAELFIVKREKGDKTFTNIVGLKRVGMKEFDTDGKTPVIQNRTREAGSLFNGAQ